MRVVSDSAAECHAAPETQNREQRHQHEHDAHYENQAGRHEVLN